MIPKHNDWLLIERVKAGDDQAFDQLMTRYQRPVLNFVYRMIGDAAEAEDVAQEVFVRTYHHIRKPAFHQTTAAFSSWLFQVAHHAALDVLRRRKRHPTESLSEMTNHGGSMASHEPTAPAKAMAAETGEQIAVAVRSLPEDQRTAIILSEYENLSYRQIAAIMDCSQKSVKARLYRAKTLLRRRLAHLLR